MFDAAHEKNIKKTRKTITSVVDTKKLCVYQNIQLRGHRDSTKNHPKQGNIVELLQHRVKVREKDLEKQYQNAS